MGICVFCLVEAALASGCLAALGPCHCVPLIDSTGVGAMFSASHSLHPASLTNSLVLQMFIEHLLHTRHCSRCKDLARAETDRKTQSLPSRTLHLREQAMDSYTCAFCPLVLRALKKKKVGKGNGECFGLAF